MSEEIKTTAQQGFDKEKEYNEEVIPVLKKLIEICDKHGIPFLVDCVFQCKEDGIRRRVGNGVIMHTQDREEFEAVKTMAIIGHVAYGSVSLEKISQVYLAFGLADKIFGNGGSK